jgi:hypothetical protein
VPTHERGEPSELVISKSQQVRRERGKRVRAENSHRRLDEPHRQGRGAGRYVIEDGEG